MKSPCVAWEGCLGKGSGGFCAGETGGGGGQEPRELAHGHGGAGWGAQDAVPGCSASLHPAVLPRKMVQCKI